MTNKIVIDWSNLPVELAAGLEAIRAEFPARFWGAEDALAVEFAPHSGPGSWSAQFQATCRVSYQKPIHAFRALGRIFGAGHPPETGPPRTPRS
jgi:hypothetical protein